VRGIDIGYGNTKFVKQPLTDAFPEVCGLFPSITTITSSRRIADSTGMSRDTIRVPVDGVLYEVGPDVIIAQGGNAYGRSLAAEFSTTPEYKALVLGALHYMNVEFLQCLVLGLPVNTYQNARLRSDLQQSMMGEHDLGDGKFVTINYCSVKPQPLGGFYDFATRSTGNGRSHLHQMINEVNLVIDPGYNTLDWLLTHGTRINDERSGAAPKSGVTSILDAIRSDLEVDHGEIGNIDRLDAAIHELLRSGDATLKISGEPVNLKAYKGKIDQIAAENLNRMIDALGTLADIDNVILVGGGASLFEAAVRERFPKFQVHITSEPVYANVRGFQIMGEQWLQKTKS
jgi:plasmid segregation protein ParM